MDIEKAFVKEGIATICCPECGLVKNVSVAKFRQVQHTLKIKCSCNHSFKVMLDFRSHYRKQAELIGTYALMPPASGGGLMNITNISRSGMGFTVSGIHTIKIGDNARVAFTLDNRKKTKLNKQVTIRSIDKDYIGCEFVDQQAFEKDLGFYLQP